MGVIKLFISIPMVQVVILTASGDSRTLRTNAFNVGEATGESVAHVLRKKTPATLVATYSHKEITIQIWGWTKGRVGTENTHYLPNTENDEEVVDLFGDAVVVNPEGDITNEQYIEFINGIENEEDNYSESEADDLDEVVEEVEDADDADEADEAEDAEDAEDAEEAEDAEDAEDAEEAEEAEEEAEEAEDDCYNDGDENGGGSKRRAPRSKTTSNEMRKMDVGLRSKLKLPIIPGKRAPKWQTEPELLPDTTALNNTRQTVLSLLQFIPDSQEIELGILNYSIEYAKQKGIKAHMENPDFINVYKLTSRRVISNVNPSTYVGNKRLLQRIQEGELSAKNIAFMSHNDLFPEHWQALADEQSKRENTMLEGDKEGGSDMFKCRRCGKSKTKYWEMQTRSADEPMTIFIRCLNCGKEWRQ